jgi:hypothetical protein
MLLGSTMKKYAPEFFGLILALLSLNLWYLSSIAIDGGVLPIGYGILKDLMAPAIGALAGSFYAYKLSKDKEDKKDTHNEVKKLNQVLLHIALQLNSLANLRCKLNEYKNIHELAFNLNAEKNYNSSTIFDLSEVSFIFSDKPRLLMELSIAQDCFISTVQSHEVRNHFFLNILSPILIEKKLTNRIVSLEEFEKHVPDHFFKAAYDSITVLKENLEGSEKSLESAFLKLRSECVNKYEGHAFHKPVEA